MRKSFCSMLLTIVDRGKGEGVVNLLQQEGFSAHFILLGSGTAQKDLLGLLGLRDTDKDVVVSFLAAGRAARAMARLSYALDIDLPGRGIAFTVPLHSVGGQKTLEYLAGEVPAAQEEEDMPMEEIAPEYELIVAIVNHGYVDTVMTAAVSTGARGGTVVHARGAGADEASRFLGITIQPEKEMALILTGREQKIPIMQSIVRASGLNTEGRGLVFSLPVTDVMGVVRMTNQTKEEDDK